MKIYTVSAQGEKFRRSKRPSSVERERIGKLILLESDRIQSKGTKHTNGLRNPSKRTIKLGVAVTSTRFNTGWAFVIKHRLLVEKGT